MRSRLEQNEAGARLLLTEQVVQGVSPETNRESTQKSKVINSVPLKLPSLKGLAVTFTGQGRTSAEYKHL